MVTKESIDAAWAAHAQWKKRLPRCNRHGTIGIQGRDCQTRQCLPIRAVAMVCQWRIQEARTSARQRLCTPTSTRLPAKSSNSPLAGKKQEALQKLETGGQVRLAQSGKLVLVLQTWKGKL